MYVEISHCLWMAYFLGKYFPQEGWLTTGCAHEGFPILQGEVTTLVFVEETMTADYPTIGVYLVLKVIPLTTDATWAGGFPLVVEDMGELEVDPWFEIVVIGRDVFPRLGTIEPRASDLTLGVTGDDEGGRYPRGFFPERQGKRADMGVRWGISEVLKVIRFYWASCKLSMDGWTLLYISSFHGASVAGLTKDSLVVLNSEIAWPIEVLQKGALGPYSIP